MYIKVLQDNFSVASLRTDQKITSNKKLGTVLFGGNHTNTSEANVLYAASIAGVAGDDFDSETDMPTDLVFYTGSTGAPAVPNVSSGTERLRISSGGNIGINSTTPQDHAGLVIDKFGGNAQDNVALAIRSYNFNQYLRIARGGTSGVGDVSITNNFTRTGGSEWTLDTPSNDANAIQFSATAGIRFRHIVAPGTATISSYPTEIMRVDENGLNIYSNGINFAQVNADPAGGATVVEETLDQYDVGSWVPEWNGSTSNPTVTYDQQQGYYVRIGRLCYITGRLRSDAASGGSGNLRIGNLPFSALNSGARRGVMHTGYRSAFTTTAPDTGLVRHNNRYIELYAYNGTGMTNITTSNLSNSANSNNIHFDATYITST